MKRVLSLSMFLLLSAAVMAQDPGFGLKAGLNASNFRSQDNSDYSVLIGYQFGVYGYIPISERIGFQPELVYSLQGAASDIVDAGLHYINIPLMFKFYVADGLNLQIGPYVGFLVGESFSSDLADFDSEGMADSFEGFDVGGQAGVAYELDGGFNFGARYIYGFADINKGYDETFDGDPVVFSPDISSDIIAFWIGYTF